MLTLINNSIRKSSLTVAALVLSLALFALLTRVSHAQTYNYNNSGGQNAPASQSPSAPSTQSSANTNSSNFTPTAAPTNTSNTSNTTMDPNTNTPGIPATGAGGEAPDNFAILAGSLVTAAAGITMLRKQGN